MFESALDILVTEAEGLVGPFREKYDPSAAEGMPAHITINYPYRIRDQGGTIAIDELKRMFSNVRQFSFALAEVQRFPNVLYLAPTPEKPFKDLINLIADRFPDSPPYGGAFNKVIPHLTVAQSEDIESLDAIEEVFMPKAGGLLPIESSAKEVWLADNRGGVWRHRISFTLGDAHPADNGGGSN